VPCELKTQVFSESDAGHDHRLITHLSLGVKQEIQVCHAQPHLVPPMKLVVYDNLPSPSLDRQQHTSLTSWIPDRRNLARRASTRASMSWKKQSTVPLRISAPSDFRKVESFSFQPPPLPTKYQPLELSIYRSGNRLSGLPEFDSFEFDEGRHRQTLAVPPRALSLQGVRAQRCQSANPRLSMSRKSIGSGNQRSLIHPDYLVEPAQSAASVRIASALIPHFSIVNPVESLLSEEELIPATIHLRPSSDESQLSLGTKWPDHIKEAETQTPLRLKHQNTFSEFSFSTDSPSSASMPMIPPRISSLHRRTVSENRNTIASIPLPNRTTQWSVLNRPPSPKHVSLPGEDGFSWERTRTLSGSTVASTVTTTITGGAQNRNHKSSISSTFTNDTTPRASFLFPSRSGDKDFEAIFSHPTIPEGRPQHYPYAPFQGENLIYDDSTVGLAF